MPEEVGPVAAASMRDRPLVDIREPEERRTLGWIPGSRWVSPREVARLSEPSLVIVCQSGRRSAELVRTLGRARVHSLTGGLRAWAAAGLPVCAPPSDAFARDVPPIDRWELVRQVRSRFLVEAVLARGTDGSHDPKRAIDDLFASTRLPTSRADFESRLDRLAEAAWHDEHGLDLLAQNVEWFYALAARVAWPTAGIFAMR